MPDYNISLDRQVEERITNLFLLASAMKSIDNTAGYNKNKEF